MRAISKVTFITAFAVAAVWATGVQADEHAGSTATRVVDDTAITASVKTRLIGDETTKARQISVDTTNGVVELTGFVDSAVARTEAERVAAGVDGVRQVRNKLEVRAPSPTAGAAMNDGMLSAKVDAALAADSRTSALTIDVESRGGEVQLSGSAKTAAEKSAATDIARGVDGVRVVRNEIEVR